MAKFFGAEKEIRLNIAVLSVAKEVRHITNRVDEDKSSYEGHYRGGYRGKGG